MSTLMNLDKKKDASVQEGVLKLKIMEKIFRLMEEKKVSQAKLARKLNVSRAHVSKMLADDRNLTLTSVAKIFSALGEELEVMTSKELNELTCHKVAAQKITRINYLPKASDYQTKILPSLTSSYHHLSLKI